MKKRLLSLLAAFCLVVTLVPAPVHAADGDGGTAALGDPDDAILSDFRQRVNSLQPAEGGTKADIESVKISGGVYEIRLTGAATPSTNPTDVSAYWVGVGIAPPEGYTSAAYARGDYSINKDLDFKPNNDDGSFDDIQKGDAVKGFALWFDAKTISREGIYYTVKWSADGKPDRCEVYRFIWEGTPGNENPGGDNPGEDPDDTLSGLRQRINSLQPAEGGTKADIEPANIKKIKDGVYEIRLTGAATPSTNPTDVSAYWVGVGIAAPDGYTSAAYAKGDYSINKDLDFKPNNNDGSFDDIQKGDAVKGFAIWFDAEGIDRDGVYYTVKWSDDNGSVLLEVYHFIWAGTIGGNSSGGDTPGGNNPGGDDPSGDDPGGDNPGGDNPTTPSTALTGTVLIDGEPWVGETLHAWVRNTNNTGTLRYQWTANGVHLSGETSSRLRLTRYEVGKTIRCVITSSVQTGSITGRLWTTVDYYDSRYYPTEDPTDSPAKDQDNNTGAESGFTIDTPLFTTATNADGTKTTTIIEPDGSSGIVMLTSYGTVSSASMTFSSSAFAAALRTGSALTLPAAVSASRSAGSAAPVRIVLPQAAGTVKVKIPVSQMTAGTVAMMENYFGPDTVIRSSVSESNGVLFELTGSAVVKVVDNSRSFSDVSGGAWYASAVNWAASREVMNGVSARMFDPQGTVNRAMMAQMLYNFDGANDTAVASQFSDVSSGDWYAASVSWATRNGIARNDGERFGAEDALTREDMAVMLYNYARAKGYNRYASSSTLAFSDNGDVSDWALTAMQWAVGAGLISGTQNGTKAVVLDPQGTVTRAQLATIMQRFNNLY